MSSAFNLYVNVVCFVCKHFPSECSYCLQICSGRHLNCFVNLTLVPVVLRRLMFMLLPSSFMKSLGEEVHLAFLVMSPKVRYFGTTNGKLLEGAQIKQLIGLRKEFGIPSQLLIVRLVKMTMEKTKTR